MNVTPLYAPGVGQVGLRLSRLPVDPMFGRVLLAAAELGCGVEALAVVAMVRAAGNGGGTLQRWLGKPYGMVGCRYQPKLNRTQCNERGIEPRGACRCALDVNMSPACLACRLYLLAHHLTTRHNAATPPHHLTTRHNATTPPQHLTTRHDATTPRHHPAPPRRCLRTTCSTRRARRRRSGGRPGSSS